MNKIIKLPEDLPELILYFKYFLNMINTIPEEVSDSCLILCKERLNNNQETRLLFEEIKSMCGVRLDNDEELTAISLAIHLFAKNRNW